MVTRIGLSRLERPTETTAEQHDKKASGGGDCRVHCPKLNGAHLLVEAADPADQVVRNEQAHKSKSHQGGVHFGRRSARNQCEKCGPVVEERDSQSCAIK